MRSAFLLGALGLALVAASPAWAQTVSMSGDYGQSDGIFHYPLNPPKLPCTGLQNARCAQRITNYSPFTVTQPFGAPALGVPVDGGARVMNGGLAVADPFTVPASVFKQSAAPHITPVPGGVPGMVQLDTTLSFFGPAPARALNPPAQTRVFQAQGWNGAGAGQTGRIAATTTPVQAQTQTQDEVTVRYIPGPNAFGGTMANLRDGDGRAYYATIFRGTFTAPKPDTRTWIGSIPIGDGIAGNPVSMAGAGWNYTVMDAREPGIVRRSGGYGPPCTSILPPGPAGCRLVTDFTGVTAGIVQSVVSTLHHFAWTTGTVDLSIDASPAGFVLSRRLTGMGYDTTSMTTSGATIRNIGLVAGSYSRRTQAGLPLPSVSNRIEILGLNLRFTPEPAKTASLICGLLLIALLADHRRSEARHLRL